MHVTPQVSIRLFTDPTYSIPANSDFAYPVVVKRFYLEMSTKFMRNMITIKDCQAAPFSAELNTTAAIRIVHDYCADGRFDVRYERPPAGYTHIARISMKKFKFQNAQTVTMQCTIHACGRLPCGSCQKTLAELNAELAEFNAPPTTTTTTTSTTSTTTTTTGMWWTTTTTSTTTTTTKTPPSAEALETCFQDLRNNSLFMGMTEEYLQNLCLMVLSGRRRRMDALDDVSSSQKSTSEEAVDQFMTVRATFPVGEDGYLNGVEDWLSGLVFGGGEQGGSSDGKVYDPLLPPDSLPSDEEVVLTRNGPRAAARERFFREQMEAMQAGESIVNEGTSAPEALQEQSSTAVDLFTRFSRAVFPRTGRSNFSSLRDDPRRQQAARKAQAEVFSQKRKRRLVSQRRKHQRNLQQQLSTQAKDKGTLIKGGMLPDPMGQLITDENYEPNVELNAKIDQYYNTPPKEGSALSNSVGLLMSPEDDAMLMTDFSFRAPESLTQIFDEEAGKGTPDTEGDGFRFDPTSLGGGKSGGAKSFGVGSLGSHGPPLPDGLLWSATSKGYLTPGQAASQLMDQTETPILITSKLSLTSVSAKWALSARPVLGKALRTVLRLRTAEKLIIYRIIATGSSSKADLRRRNLRQKHSRYLTFIEDFPDPASKEGPPKNQLAKEAAPSYPATERLNDVLSFSGAGQLMSSENAETTLSWSSLENAAEEERPPGRLLHQDNLPHEHDDRLLQASTAGVDIEFIIGYKQPSRSATGQTILALLAAGDERQVADFAARLDEQLIFEGRVPVALLPDELVFTPPEMAK